MKRMQAMGTLEYELLLSFDAHQLGSSSLSGQFTIDLMVERVGWIYNVAFMKQKFILISNIDYCRLGNCELVKNIYNVDFEIKFQIKKKFF